MSESESHPVLMLGKYRLIAELGRGGMAEVFLALANPGMNFVKLVVIKKPREHLANDIEFMTMLVDEARIAARLNHPNLVQTIEVGEANGQHFLTMEYLDGQPLHRILNRVRSTFPTPMFLSVLVDVCAGVHYAHELKDFDGTPLHIIHRDVTPHNVFVTYEGQVKVVDFGIAKAVGRASETRHGVVKGKTPYMAPEQASSREVDRRADIFTIGVMILEATLHRRMWKGVSEIDIIRSLVAGRIPASPKAVDASTDDELDRICQMALAFQPEDRYPTAAALQQDLEAYLASKGPRPSAREIGAYCAELFADKRAMTNKIIETQLAHLKSASSRPRMVQVLEASDASPIGATSSDNIPLASGPPTAPPAARPAISATTRVDPPKDLFDSVRLRSSASVKPLRALVIALAALALAFAAAALVIFALRPTDTSSPSAGTLPTGTITITLRATPLETRFTVDDGPLLDNPFIGTYPRDGREHRIQAVAPGYPPRHEAVVFQEDISLRFALAERGSNKKK